MCATTCLWPVALKCKSGIWCSFPQTLWLSSLTVCVICTYHSTSKKTEVTKIPLLLNIPWSQFSLLKLFLALAMLCSCYFQSPLHEAKVKIHCLSPTWASLMKTSKNNTLSKCRTVTSFTSFSLPISADWRFPILGQNKILSFLLQFLYLKLV